MENKQKEIDIVRISLQNFLKMLSKYPDDNEFQKTPDGKAFYLPIDFIETSLDELFFGLWQTEKFEYKVIANEVTASIELKIFHPVAQIWLTRVGTASYTIMVDKAPEGLVGQQKNQWYLDIANKKPNALDMGLPKLKSDCLKNACLSLGNIFGRSVNRKHKDTYKPLIKDKWNINKLNQSNENTSN